MKRVLLMFVTVLLMVFSVMGINVNAEIEESMPFDGNDFSEVEKVNENAVTDAESEEGSQLQIVLRDNAHDRTGTNFVVNGKQVGDVTGLSWDEQSRILTMNNAELADFTLDIIVQQFADYDSGITIQLIGNNEVCQVVADPETTLAGDGTLNAGQFIATHFTMTSGVLNLESTRLAPLYAGFGMPYPTDRATGYALFNDNYGSVEEPNLYRFLGGSVSISGDYLAGIDVQSGNVEIANTDIKINIPKYGRFGLAVGWAKGNEYWGGDLKIENARVEIISDEYMTYFYHLEDSNNNLNYYVGSGKSQEKVTFDEAFVLQDTGSIKRYSRNTYDFPGKNYLLITNENLFADVVDHEKFYFDAVYWALDNEITVGAGGPGKFSPAASCTREQFVTFLWRMEGKPEPEKGCTFSDVPESAWYYKSISWAAEKGITTGLNDGTNRFGVGQACTREQCVTFLHRAAGSPEPEGSIEFTDSPAGRYYYKAIKWAAGKGITVGLNDGTGRFGVGQKCTRGMLVTFLYRYAHAK